MLLNQFLGVKDREYLLPEPTHKVTLILEKE